jgi:hypothetical protein
MNNRVVLTDATDGMGSFSAVIWYTEHPERFRLEMLSR